MTHAGSEGSLSRLELVVLARMSSPTVPDPKQLGEAVRTLVLPAESARARQRALEVVAELWQRGLVEDHPLPRRRAAKPRSVPASDAAAPVAPPKPGRRLTEGGRRALARALGLDVAPAWGKARDEHLPALGSGLAPGSDDARRRLASGGAVVAAELRAALGVAHAPTVTALCDALIIEALGLPPGAVTLARIRAHVLAQRIGVDTRGDAAQIAARAVSARLGAPNATKASLARALARRWASQDPGMSGPSAEPVAAPPTRRASGPTAPSSAASRDATEVVAPVGAAPPTEALLAMVRDAIAAIGADGRYGPDKVFVSALWQRLSREAQLAGYTLDRFKRWLVTANRDRALDLARADLVGAMDPRLVADSEIADLGATFHFVLDRGVRSLDPDRRTHAR